MHLKVLVTTGGGIGPELANEAVRVLKTAIHLL
jgi:isocitrate/isopropylmalate dehydrogenase